MKRKLVVFLIAAAALVIAAGVAVRILVKPERVKEEALARIRAASGYAVEAGEASLKLGLSGAGIRVRNVRLASPDSIQVIAVEEIDLYAKLLPLLRRRVDLTRVVLNRPDYLYDATRSARPDRSASPPAAGAVLAVRAWSVHEGTFRQRAGWGALELTGLELGGTFRWGGVEGGAGDAAGKAAGGSMQGALGTFPIPPLDAHGEFRVPADLDSVLLSEIAVRSGSLALALHGAYARGGQGYYGALSGSMEPVSWEAVRPWIPAEMLHGAELAGTFALPELRLVRDPAGASWAEGTIEFHDLAAKHPAAPLGLTAFGGSARFGRDEIVVERAAGRVGEDPLTLSAHITGVKEKTARVRVETRLDGATLGRLVPPGAPLHLARGAVVIDLEVVTPVPPPPKSLPTSMRGSVVLEGLAGTFRELSVEDLHGELRFAGQGAEVKGLGARCGRSDFTLNGTLADLGRPDLRFRLVSNMLDLDELMPEAPDKSKTPAEPVPASAAIGVPGTGTVEVRTLRMRGTEIHNLRGDAAVGLEGITLDKVTGEVGDGKVAGNLALHPLGSPDAWSYTGGLELSAVPVDPLVGRWGGVASLLDGSMTGNLSWDGRAQKGIDPRRGLSLSGDLSLNEGALENLPALKTLAQTFKVAGGTPERWPFQSLGLRFHVKDGNVLVDGLEMAQAGLAWKLGGSVGIDGALALTGSVRADPDRVALPSKLSFLSPFLAEKDGKIPVDFRLGGNLASPAVVVDWDAMAKRAGDRLKEDEGKKLNEKLAPQNKEALDKLKNLLGGKKGG